VPLTLLGVFAVMWCRQSSPALHVLIPPPHWPARLLRMVDARHSELPLLTSIPPPALPSAVCSQWRNAFDRQLGIVHLNAPPFPRSRELPDSRAVFKNQIENRSPGTPPPPMAHPCPATIG